MDWQEFARGWLDGLSNPDQNDFGEAIIILNFLGSAEDNWKFIHHAFKLARTDEELSHLAAGPLEHFLGKSGEEYINQIEDLADKDPRFNRLLTGVWKHLMSDHIWERIKKLQVRVPDPLPEYKDE